MTDRRVGAYVGIDPTASSLHVGPCCRSCLCSGCMSMDTTQSHFSEEQPLKLGTLQDRLTTREKQHSSTRANNMVSMHYQLKKLWLNVEVYGRKYGYNWEWSWKRELVNNNAWMNKLPIMEVLQVLGPGMRMGAMLARET